MVAPAVCEGHVRRSLVRLPGGFTDITAGAVVADLSRGSSLAAMIPINPYLDHPFQSRRPPQSPTSTPAGKGSTPLPWATTPGGPPTTVSETSRGQSTEVPARAAVTGLTTSPSSRPTVQVQHPRSVTGIPIQGLINRPRGTVSQGLTPSVSSVLATLIPSATPNTGVTIQGPLVTSSTGATAQRLIKTSASNITRGANRQVPGEAATKKAAQTQRATAGYTTTLTGKRKLEGDTGVTPVASGTRPAKLTRTESYRQAEIPCAHNPQLVEENQRLRQVVQGLMQQVGVYRQLLRRSEAIRTGVAVR